MTTQPQKYLDGGATTYEEKNSDYGDSWRKVGEILHLLADGEPITLESPEDHISYGLFTRRLDKFARAFHGEFMADEMNFESIEDAHTDEMTYAAMSASNYDARRQDRQSNSTSGIDDSGDGTISGGAAELSTKAGEIYDRIEASIDDGRDGAAGGDDA